jgi:hypothetical protein
VISEVEVHKYKHIHAFRAVRLSDIGYGSLLALGDLIIDSRCDCGLSAVDFLLSLADGEVLNVEE